MINSLSSNAEIVKMVTKKFKKQMYLQTIKRHRAYAEGIKSNKMGDPNTKKTPMILVQENPRAEYTKFQ